LRAGDVTFVVTKNRRPLHLLANFQALGLDPTQVRILVVKSGYLVPEIKTLAARTMMALSPGAVDQAVERQPRQRYPKGIFPFDDLAEFTPAVRWTD
jgi:microcystin degradation protein MlrC